MNAMCRVLVVEDEYIMQQGIKYLVDWEREGFEIVGSASNGREALALVDDLRPHIVLTDVVMPVMNGVELTEALQRVAPQIQVVILSGYSDFEYVRGAFQGGAVDYILKPTLNPQVLLETMRRAAGRIPGFSLSREESSPEVCLGRILAGFQSGEETGILQKTLPLERFHRNRPGSEGRLLPSSRSLEGSSTAGAGASCPCPSF
jgi:two-component system response regulator YesN